MKHFLVLIKWVGATMSFWILRKIFPFKNEYIYLDIEDGIIYNTNFNQFIEFKVLFQDLITFFYEIPKIECKISYGDEELLWIEHNCYFLNTYTTTNGVKYKGEFVHVELTPANLNLITEKILKKNNPGINGFYLTISFILTLKYFKKHQLHKPFKLKTYFKYNQ